MSPLPTTPARVPESWVQVFLRDGSVVHVRLECVPALDAALEAQVGAGASRFTEREDRESVLNLIGLTGQRVVLLSGCFYGFLISTPETRRLERARDAMLEREVDAERPAESASVEYRR